MPEPAPSLPHRPAPRPSLAEVFWAFLRLGLTAFGGPVMVAYIRRLAVDERGWLDEARYKRGVATAQRLPGATAMQAAAYVGLVARGVPGGLAAYAGFVLPAFLMVLGLSALYVQTRDLALAQELFAGLQAVVVALILNAAIDFSRRFLPSAGHKAIALGAGVWFALRLNPIVAILASCAVGALALRSVRPDAGARGAGGGGWLPGVLRVAAACAAGLGLLALFAPALFDLAWVMLKVDLFAFGGGYVSVPLMLHEVVDAHAWMDAGTFMDGVALGQLTPGPIVITACFVGYVVAGAAGAAVASLAVFALSFLLLAAAAPFYERLAGSAWVERALAGSLASLVGLMAAVSGLFALGVEWTWWRAAVFAAALVALRLRVDVLWVVLAGAGLSLLSAL